MQPLTKRQCEEFTAASQEQRRKARMLCDETGCFAVHYGHADYDTDNSITNYEFCLTPLDEEQYEKLVAERRQNHPTRLIFTVFER